MTINITAEDFEFLGVLAPNCDKPKLAIAIKEALDFDLKPVFKDCDISAKLLLLKVVNYQDGDEEPTKHEKDLVDGIFFEHENKHYENLGLKRGLIYYAYARYYMINGINDSSTGMVTKTNTFSMPKTQSELEQVANKYRNLGRFSFESSFEFIALHHDEFKQLHCIDFSLCKCHKDNRKSQNIDTKGFGFVGGNVYKKRF